MSALSAPLILDRYSSGGSPIEIEYFGPAGSPSARSAGIMLLHGAEGLALAESYRSAARSLASAGFGVAFPHYLDRTGSRVAVFSKIRQNYGAWAGAVQDGLAWLAARPGIDPTRLGVVGISLGAALALETTIREGRVRALVNFSGPLLEGVPARAVRLPPTLVLHGALDGVVSVDHAYAWEKLLKLRSAPYELKIYPDQGHVFVGAAQLDAAGRVEAFLARHLGARSSSPT